MQKPIPSKKQIYAKAIELDFLTNLMKHWKKRNHKLLHIGLNQGIEPTFFWDLGFEVTAYALNLEELDESQKNNGKMIEYSLGALDCLPFEDKTFDYVVLSHALASSPFLSFASHSRIKDFKNTLTRQNKKQNSKVKSKEKDTVFEKIIQESVRVCANSLLIIENSSFAFEILSPAISPLYLRQICDEADTHEHSLHFALSAPALAWANTKAVKSCLAMPHKFPFGSLVALQIDISQEVMTSLPNYVSYALEDI